MKKKGPAKRAPIGGAPTYVYRGVRPVKGLVRTVRRLLLWFRSKGSASVGSRSVQA